MSGLNTFFSWRGAHHGKATRRAVGRQTDFMRGAERARWRSEHPGVPYPHELQTVAEQNAGMLRGEGEPWHPAVWWTVVVLAGLCGLTVIGLVVTAALAPAIVARNPYRNRPPHQLPHAELVAWQAELDPPTRPLPTVPDPVQTYRLPTSSGRHAR